MSSWNNIEVKTDTTARNRTRTFLLDSVKWHAGWHLRFIGFPIYMSTLEFPQELTCKRKKEQFPYANSISTASQAKTAI